MARNPNPPSPFSAYKRYRREFEHSYVFGASPTVELLRSRPEQVIRVLVSEDFHPKDPTLLNLCEQQHIPWEYNGTLLRRLTPKENCLAVGVLRKQIGTLEEQENHIVLVHPSDMGNLGTVLRTAVGFGLSQIAVIRPGADCFDPKAVRASMGALFRADVAYFDCFEDYTRCFPHRILYPFLLSDRATPLPQVQPEVPFSLIFGNESSGLDPQFEAIGIPVIIPHTQNIDSLNLSIAAGIGMYHFTTYFSNGKE